MSQNIDKQIAAMSDRAKERVWRACRAIKSDVEVATQLGLGVLVVGRLRAAMMPTRGTGIPNNPRAPKHLSEDAIPLDLRYNNDAIIGSRMLLVRMLETGTHWLNAERFRAVINELKSNVAATADPRTDIRRRINCL